MTPTAAEMEKARKLAHIAETYFDADDDEFVENFAKDIAAALAEEREAGVCQAIDAIELHDDTLPFDWKRELVAAIRTRGK